MRWWKSPKFELHTKLDTTYGECIDVVLNVREFGLDVKVKYRRKFDYFSRLMQFEFVAAYSYYDEHMMPVFPNFVGDSLYEVFGSEWSKRFESRRSPADKKAIRHFAIHFSDCAFFEVLCRDVSVSQERPDVEV